MVAKEEIDRQLARISKEITSGNYVSIGRFHHLAGKIDEYKDENGEIDEVVLDRLNDILRELESNDEYSDTHQNRVAALMQSVLDNRLDNISFSTGELNEIDEIDEENNVVFLFGAGASHASGIPLVSDLLTELVEQAKRTQNEEFNKLMLACGRDENIGVEDLLTAVYLAEFAVSEASTLNLLKTLLFTEESVPTPSLSSGDQSTSEPESPLDDQIETDPTSVNFIQDAIQTLFGSIASEMIPDSGNKTHVDLQRFIESHENTSIITTNYDYCIEEQLFGQVSVDTTLNEIPADSESANSVELYKMHGSITWTYCDTCQSIDCVEPEKVRDKFDPDEGTLGYPVKGICHVCSGERRPLLVPPTSFKFVQFPPLIDIRANAKEELQQADYIIPVGYSFSDQDAYIYKLVWDAMRSNDDAQMIIVDPEARPLSSDLQEQFEVQASDFDFGRVVPVTGKSEEVLGDVVDQLLGAESPADAAGTNAAAAEGDDD